MTSKLFIILGQITARPGSHLSEWPSLWSSPSGSSPPYPGLCKRFSPSVLRYMGNSCEETRAIECVYVPGFSRSF